ncbi:trimeric intracellular cation channel family protein [Corynebacterium sp. ES2794-CONJ1]|uniref:trimeric intracellular cation channel family protein n=1 Tax=unclassified Corynebacterium TaxID=2624378 RepID=UPI00216817BB|nr:MULTISPECIES: trimeric intracellular cation channel family protein [unclassified Corynebacterium]MCS4490601.1 trimeric intracellular cation channel family protein [Corynebacterium sp. ES2775-CONJ]MCS4492380.1 trimeric intracellular cation channel family protein [Corynebacterium sp. ES2715-CONJ3]MCS4532428.1 trimeric intracellular cation channel family protein [Corynebacterium sp. ES2730-CONJ]MCU9519823.1 trimeric intracellular cation channel family protein [Corynebacterium sp. ES2794-CONJ1]
MADVDPLIWNLYQIFDLIGVVLNGIIGGTIARQRNFDFVGFVFLALFSALGGGMIRDVLMQRGTAAAIADPTYLLLALLGAVIALVTALKGRAWELFKVHADAIILGVWAVTGCVKAVTFDMPLVSAVFMGVITAVGGGMIRDVVTGQVPTIFGGGTLYAVPASASAAAMAFSHAAGHDVIGMIIAPLIGAGLAIIAYWRGWVLFRSSEWAPVNMTAAQLRALIKRAERKGWNKGRGSNPTFEGEFKNTKQAR